jgi:hypothetical protein
VYGAGVYRAIHGGRLVSRFVLYEDARFGLQFSSPTRGFFEYAGQYVRTDTGIGFAFAGASIAGPWQAFGTASGDRLSVSYNELMQHSDFVDGVYVRVPDAP